MKKYLFFIFCVFTTQYAISQCTLTIKQVHSKIDTLPELFVANYEDSCLVRINDSTLKFSYYPSEPNYVIIIINDKIRPRWMIWVWINPEIKNKVLTINYSQKTTMLDFNEWDIISEKWRKLRDEHKLNESDSFASDFINQHPNSYLSLWFLSQEGAWGNKNKRYVLFNKLSSSLNEYSLYRQTKAGFLDRKYPNIGDPFKEFALVDFNDSIFNTNSIHNKWILLHFWANWCGPCVREMDALGNLYDSIDTSKVKLISVSLDYEKNTWKKATTTAKTKWTSLWAENNTYCDLCLNYNLTAMPFFILFDNDKKIYFIKDGAEELENIKDSLKIKGLLK